MTSPFSKPKGFKNDKRRLLESTNNLVVFGVGQDAPENLNGRGRRPSCHPRATGTKTKPLVPGPPATIEQRTQKRTITRGSRGSTSQWNNNCYVNHRNQLLLETKTVSASNPYPEVPSTVPPSIVPSLRFQDIQLKDDFICPLCNRTFEPSKFASVPVHDLMRHSYKQYIQQAFAAKRTLEDNWGLGTNKKLPVPAEESVVVAACGELFHKICFRDWCCRTHNRTGSKQSSPRSGRALACPSCGKEVRFSSCIEVDVVSSYVPNTAFEKAYVNTRHIHKELQVQWPEANSQLGKLRNEVTEVKPLFSELRSRRRFLRGELNKLTPEDLSAVMATITDVKSLKIGIDKQDRAVEYMKQESLRLMRMYLITLIRKLKRVHPSGDFSSISLHKCRSNERIPPMLMSYLQEILNDDHALALLSQIVAPLVDSEMNADKRMQLASDILERLNGLGRTESISRTETYTVITSSQNIQLKEELEVAKRNELPVAKHSTKIIPPINSIASVLQSPTVSHSVVAEKPPQIRGVLDIIQSQMTVGSLRRPRPTRPPPKSYPTPPTASSSFIARSPHSSLEVVAVSVADLKYQNIERKCSETTAPPPLQPMPSLANSKISEVSEVQEIMKIKQQNSEQSSMDNENLVEEMITNQVPPQIPSSESSIMQEQEEKPKKIHKIVDLSPRDSNTGRSWSTVSDEDSSQVKLSPPTRSQQSEQSEVNSNVKEKKTQQPPTSGAYTSTDRDTPCVDEFQDKIPVQTSSIGVASLLATESSYRSSPSSQLLSLKKSSSDHVKIAIMYIIETDEEGKGSTEASSESETEHRNVIESKPTSILTPVYLTAEKTSNYSFIANKKNSSSHSSSLAPPTKNLTFEILPARNDNSVKNIFGSGGTPIEKQVTTNIIGVPITAQQVEVVNNRDFNGNSGNCDKVKNIRNPAEAPNDDDVTVFYENEKAIKKKVKIGRKLLTI